VRNIQLNSNNL